MELQAALTDRDMTLTVVVRATEEEISWMLAGPITTTDLDSWGPLGRLLQLLMVENSMLPTLAPPEGCLTASPRSTESQADALTVWFQPPWPGYAPRVRCRPRPRAVLFAGFQVPQTETSSSEASP